MSVTQVNCGKFYNLAAYSCIQVCVCVIPYPVVEECKILVKLNLIITKLIAVDIYEESNFTGKIFYKIVLLF
jgi:hypothetical protein